MPVTLIYGDNDYVASQYYHELIAKFSSENSDKSVSYFDGEAVTKEELLEASSAQSLFGSGSELIVVKVLGSNSEAKDALVELIDTLPDTTELIIFDLKIDKRSKLYKKLKKSGLAKEFKKLSDYELSDWITQQVENSGGSIERGATKLLMDRTGSDQVRLSNELEKLQNYDKDITVDSVRVLVDTNPDDNVFNLLDKVATGDKSAALAEFDELIRAQVEPHYILAMLCWHLSNLLAIKSCGQKSDREISSALGINPYTLTKAKQMNRTLSMKQLKTMSKKAIETDNKLKTTSVDAIQLIKQLIVGL